MTQANGQAGLLGALRGCASWQDIQNKWSGYGEKLKGDLFEQLVKAYLQLEPEYASKLKHVWLYREVPQSVACKLNLPATDQGIDIVAQTHDGEFWAIQCKYRQDNDCSLTWRKISTFTGTPVCVMDLPSASSAPPPSASLICSRISNASDSAPLISDRHLTPAF